MEKYYVSDVLTESGRIYRPKVNANKRIRINNPEYDRPVKLFMVIFSVISIAALWRLEIEWVKLFSRAGELAAVFADLIKLNFSNFGFIGTSFLESVTVTVLATIYSLTAGIAMGALMAANITPSKKLAKALSAFNSLIRAIPTAVWVLIMLACLGFGPAPGVVGLSFHAAAFFARAFSQAFEEVPQATIEALLAAGANRIQIFFSAILPASFTNLIAWGAMRFEINFSESAILGMVGGGGIGYCVMANIHGYDYGAAGVAILMMFVFSFTLELIFTAIKHKLKVS